MAGRREMEASSRRLGLVRPFMHHLNLHMYERRLSHEHLSCGSDRVDQGGMSGGSGGGFVVSGASWWLWEADNFPRSVTHSFDTACGAPGAFIVRGSSSTWPRSGRNRVDQDGMSRRLKG